LEEIAILNRAFSGLDNDNFGATQVNSAPKVDTLIRFKLQGIYWWDDNTMAKRCQNQNIAQQFHNVHKIPRVANVYTCDMPNFLGYTFNPCTLSDAPIIIQWDTMKPIPGTSFNAGGDVYGIWIV
jgi:hypothetical protein